MYSSYPAGPSPRFRDRTVTFVTISKAGGRGLTPEEKARVLDALVSKKEKKRTFSTMTEEKATNRKFLNDVETYTAGTMMELHLHDKLYEYLSGYDLSVMTATFEGPLVKACVLGCRDCVSICLTLGADPDDAMTSIDMFSGPKHFNEAQGECLNMIYYRTKDYNRRVLQAIKANKYVVTKQLMMDLEYQPTDWTCQL